MSDRERFASKFIRDTARRFPWYAAEIGSEKLESNTKIDWSELPLMTSERLERHYYSAEPPPEMNVYRTSGTSGGRRKAIVYSEEDERRYVELKSRLFNDFLQGSGCRKALTDVGTGHAAATADTVFEKVGLHARSISFERPIEEHLRMLETYRPDVLYTMPSILERLAAHGQSMQRFGIRRIILVGEIAAPSWQEKIAQLFGLQRSDILDTYGSIEIGTIAGYSPVLDRYILMDGLYGETVTLAEIGLEGQLAADEAVLVLTAWQREAFPAIRFVTYDVVRDFRPLVVNGELRQTFRSIVKRVGKELKHGEKISLYDVEDAVFTHLDQAVVRLQVQRNELMVWIQSERWNDRIAAAIQRDVERRIPEIGRMIECGILSRIDVRRMLGSMPEQDGGRLRKSKKIYYSEKG